MRGLGRGDADAVNERQLNPLLRQEGMSSMHRRFIVTGLVAALLVFVGAASGAGSGNGAPSGPHYNLNIIGVPKGKSASMTGSDGHSLFVPLAGQCKINLQEGPFQVLDRNCTDGSSLFQLPNPDPSNSGQTVYSVWARALGKPGGSSSTQTCFVDTSTNETYCSIYQMVLVRSSGKSSFSNVSQQLLYVYYCDVATGKIVRVPLFSSPLYDFYWSYTNNGLKLAQLRFYQVSTQVASAGQSC